MSVEEFELKEHGKHGDSGEAVQRKRYHFELVFIEFEINANG